MTERPIVTGRPYPRAAFGSQGVMYMALVFWVAAFSLASMAMGMMWRTANQRSAERELLFVGNEFRQAIADYYERTPGTVKRYPQSLEDLLRDRRHLQLLRHLRRLYRDPLTHRQDWGLVGAPDGGIMGVYSLAPGIPLKQAGFEAPEVSFNGQDSYAGWQFSYVPKSAFISP